MLIKQYKTYQAIQKLPGGAIYRLANGTTGEMPRSRAFATRAVTTGQQKKHYLCNNKVICLNRRTMSDNYKITDKDKLSYTAFNKVEQINEGSYTLDFTYGLDRARKKTELKEDGTPILRKYFFGSYEIREDLQEGNTYEYHFLPGGAIYRTENGMGKMLYTYSDYLGSITHITDSAGNLLHEQSFDAWGRARNPDTYEYPDAVQTRYSASLTNDRGYTGHCLSRTCFGKMLPQFGLINIACPELASGNGRLYDPILGRMLSPCLSRTRFGNPYVQMPDYSQNFNRYSYVLNNPLKYTDPSGDSFWLAAAMIAGAYFGGVATNNGELNPGQWNLTGEGAWKTYAGVAVGAGLGYLGGWYAANPGNLSLAIGAGTPVGSAYLVGSNSDWSFQWTTMAGGGGAVPLYTPSTTSGFYYSRNTGSSNLMIFVDSYDFITGNELYPPINPSQDLQYGNWDYIVTNDFSNVYSYLGDNYNTNHKFKNVTIFAHGGVGEYGYITYDRGAFTREDYGEWNGLNYDNYYEAQSFLNLSEYFSSETNVVLISCKVGLDFDFMTGTQENMNVNLYYSLDNISIINFSSSGYPRIKTNNIAKGMMQAIPNISPFQFQGMLITPTGIQIIH
jgi:RHS repeat-associated protein